VHVIFLGWAYRWRGKGKDSLADNLKRQLPVRPHRTANATPIIQPFPRCQKGPALAPKHDKPRGIVSLGSLCTLPTSAARRLQPNPWESEAHRLSRRLSSGLWRCRPRRPNIHCIPRAPMDPAARRLLSSSSSSSLREHRSTNASTRRAYHVGVERLSVIWEV
jgi:hypothetical protein